MSATAKVIVRTRAREGDYTMVDPRRHPALEPCCVCGSKPQVWRYADTEESSTVAVMCSNGDGFDEVDPFLLGAGCLLYMPPQKFYRPRIVEAVEYWNQYQRVCVAMRGG